MRSFYISAPFITWTMFLAHGKLEQKKHVLNSEILNWFENNHVISLSLIFLSLQFKFIFHPWIFIKLCCLILLFQHINLHFLLSLKWIVHDTCIPSPSVCLFPHLLRTFFDFPRRVWVIRSQLYPFKNLLSQSNLL